MRTNVATILVAWAMLAAAVAAAGAAAGEPGQLVERAARALAAGPYRFDFELESTGEGPRLSGSARVAPLADGSSRYRIDARRGGAGGPPGALAASDDGETVRVLDGASGRLWQTPRYRAGGFLASRYLGSLLPLALSPRNLRGAGRYRTEIGEPLAIGGRTCDTVVIPLPRGAWRLSFDRRTAAPCRFELETGDEGTSELAVLRIRDFERGGSASGFALEPPSGVETAEFTPGGPVPGQPAPALSVELPGGSRWRLAERRGEVVLVDFWATWCAPCKPAMVELQELLDGRPGSALAAIGLNVMDGGDRERFFRGLGLRYPWAVADDQSADWGIDQTGIPALFVVGKDGRLAEYFLGTLDDESRRRLAATVDRELAR